MKKLSKLVLLNLESKELNERQMSQIKGGNSCGCGCCYYGNGGSSDRGNGLKNCSTNQHSSACASIYWATWGC